jgi:hypothetical protein
LIAADIDKTLLVQDSDERERFFLEVAPELVQSAVLGANLCFLTGNSMEQLSNRFLAPLLEHVSHTGRPFLLDRFHFFCNSGGIYAHFPSEDRELQETMSSSSGGKTDRLLHTLLEDRPVGRQIAPRFIVPEYLRHSLIAEQAQEAIGAILEGARESYVNRLRDNRDTLASTYNLAAVMRDGDLVNPHVEFRHVDYVEAGIRRTATVQITVKPILSFRHANSPEDWFDQDPRRAVIDEIQAALDAQGLGRFVARPGGRSSIDVTLERTDKAYALEYLINRTGVRGSRREGKLFGSNTIYLGDEVIVGGGNDYPVTRIPGLLVFAVNAEPELVPFRSNVFIPSSVVWGPEAAAEVLREFNKCARRVVRESESRTRSVPTTAVDELKRQLFSQRVRDKIRSLENKTLIGGEEWQILHAFVTLLGRADPAAKRWLRLLITELDDIMTHLAEAGLQARVERWKVTGAGIGSSHPDA